MTTTIAVIALLISVASFAFGIYQYRILHQVRISEKATSIVRFAHDLRRKSEDLKNLIESTDHVDDYAEFLSKFNGLIENGILQITTPKAASLKTLARIEQLFLPLELEVDLIHKQVAEVRRFNEEVGNHKAELAKRNEA